MPVGRRRFKTNVAQYDLAPVRFLTTVKTIREKLKKPPKTSQELIAIYEGQGLPQTAKLLRDAIELI